MFADTVYINGRIYTMECEGEATEAFAVRDHKILAVGATEEISSIACNKSWISREGLFYRALSTRTCTFWPMVRACSA